MTYTIHLWFLLTIFFILLELSNPGLFYFLSLAIGSSSSFLISFYDFSNFLQLSSCNIIVQCTMFFITSLISLILLHRYAKNNQKQKSSKAYLSNMYQLVGKTIEITQINDFCNQSGYGKIHGEVWQVKLQTHHASKISHLKVGTIATIIGVQGCHLQIVLNDQN